MRRKRTAAAAKVVNTDETKEIKTSKLPKGVKALDPKTMPPIIFRMKTLPEQRLRDKIAHDKAWLIGDSSIDLKNERFVFQVVHGIELIPQYVTFQDTCKMFGWKSFSFTKNGQTVVPVWCDNGADEV